MECEEGPVQSLVDSLDGPRPWFEAAQAVQKSNQEAPSA